MNFPVMPEPPIEEHLPRRRRTAALVRRASFWALLGAFLLNIAGLAMGRSQDGFGWAFEMPQIALCSLASLTLSVGGLILATIALLHCRGRNTALWLILAGTVITGLAAVLLLAIAIAASGSI